MYKADDCMWEEHLCCGKCNNWLCKCVEDCSECLCYKCEGEEED